MEVQTPVSEVLEELERILRFGPFAASRNKRDLLRAIVEKTLQGQTDELREKALGSQALHRGDNFDPSADSIVRTVATSVRKGLDAYYQGPGSDSKIRIVLPPGCYVAAIDRASAPAQPQPPLPDAPPAHRAKQWLAIGAGLAALLGAAWSYRAFLEPTPLLPEAPSLYPFLPGPGYSAHPVPSRDGKWVAFVSDRGTGGHLDLWLHSAQQGTVTRQLTFTPEMEMSPDFSPNGNYLVYRSWKEGGGIWRLPVQGGRELKLAQGGYAPRYSPDGRWVLYVASERVHAVSSDGGKPIQLSDAVGESRCPIWTPDGKQVLYVAKGRDGGWDWWLSPLQSPSGPRASSAGMRAVLAALGIPTTDSFPCPSDWLGESVISDWHNMIWRVKAKRGSWTMTPDARVIAGGAGVDGLRVYNGTHLLFGMAQRFNRVVTVPIGANAFADPTFATADEAVLGVGNTAISMTPDGGLLTYSSHGHRANQRHAV